MWQPRVHKEGGESSLCPSISKPPHPLTKQKRANTVLGELNTKTNTMLSLPLQHIVDLYVWIDDLVAKPPKDLSKGGRPLVLSESETITLLVWNVLLLHQKNLKDIHRFT